MEIILGQLTISLLTLSALISPGYVKAEIQTLSQPTDTVCKAQKCPVLKVPAILWEIGHCESKHVLTAKNPNSSASGEYQFIKSSWEHYGKELWGENWVNKNIFSKDNEELAIYVFKKYGTSPWKSSESCWSATSDV